MAKYINMDKLLEDIEHTVVFTLRPDKPSSINAELRGANKIIDRIRCAPAADVVEVVRCLECKFAEYIGPMDYICRRKGGCFHGMEFCSYGERKMDGGVNDG